MSAPITDEQMFIWEQFIERGRFFRPAYTDGCCDIVYLDDDGDECQYGQMVGSDEADAVAAMIEATPLLIAEVRRLRAALKAKS